MYRTKTCGELNIHNVEEVVELSGWIQKIRNLILLKFLIKKRVLRGLYHLQRREYLQKTGTMNVHYKKLEFSSFL